MLSNKNYKRHITNGNSILLTTHTDHLSISVSKTNTL